MTYDDESTSANSGRTSAQGGIAGHVAKLEQIGINNNLVRQDDEDTSGMENDKASQVDEENGFTEPSLASSYSSSSFMPTVNRSACDSSSSTSTESDAANCKQLENSALHIDSAVVASGRVISGCETHTSELAGDDEQLPAICYNPTLDDEIRNRLDKLNSLSDLINSLELQFDQANLLFRETLKCSTERLSTIAKTLGSKSIRHGRSYHAARKSVEQSQSDCQRACVQFEQANHDHQHAKEAIRMAETKLKQMTSRSHSPANQETHMNTAPIDVHDVVTQPPNTSFELSDLSRLRLEKEDDPETSNSSKYSYNDCDKNESPNQTARSPATAATIVPPSADDTIDGGADHDDKEIVRGSLEHQRTQTHADMLDDHQIKIKQDAKLSEELNQAIVRLIDAEQKRRESEKAHLDQANKLMFAQENLTKMERQHGNSIKRSQVYFDEARRFNAKLDSVKSEIARISKAIIDAKKAYARTLNELEQFSEELHISSNNPLNNKSSAGDN